MPKGDLGHILLDLGGTHASSDRRARRRRLAQFEPFEATMLPHPQTLDPDGLVAFFTSMGWLADLPDDERLLLLDDVRSRPTAAEYQRPWETHIHSARLSR